MLLNQAPRGSFSVPVNITLQGARRRHMRDVIHQQTQLQENWRKEREIKCNEKGKTQVPGSSSVGEDRAILLGFTMMIFSILMYFLVGIAMVKPCLDSIDWTDSNCTLIQADFLDEVMDCRGIISFKCLHVLVNVTDLEKTVQLHYNEEAMKFNPKCFYTPKCQRNKTERETEANSIQSTLLSYQGESIKCYLSIKYPDVALLRSEYSVQMALYYLLWPSLMFFSGILLVGLVKFNQRLAYLCTEISRDEILCKQSKLREGGIYRMLRCKPGGITERNDSS
ncbi:putative calcium-activated potassium channel subunit beta-3-like [Triplophysa rosa]|uniref:Calcium-activated potassium channel subunit beta-3-like n=1 Tax=Triplophysa rosa TaxID=992332 RepID=A0A9W7WWD2_TRIRA|nr:putative calcium-activated potassium channel subunit beta-3-like [Triplophysa rosa]